MIETLIMPEPQERALSVLKSILLSWISWIFLKTHVCTYNVHTPRGFDILSVMQQSINHVRLHLHPCFLAFVADIVW